MAGRMSGGPVSSGLLFGDKSLFIHSFSLSYSGSSSFIFIYFCCILFPRLHPEISFYLKSSEFFLRCLATIQSGCSVSSSSFMLYVVCCQNHVDLSLCISCPQLSCLHLVEVGLVQQMWKCNIFQEMKVSKILLEPCVSIILIFSAHSFTLSRLISPFQFSCCYSFLTFPYIYI